MPANTPIAKPAVGATGWNTATDPAIDQLNAGIAFGSALSGEMNSLWGNGSAQTCTRRNLGEVTGTSGRLWLMYITPPVPITVNAINVIANNTAGASITAGRLAVFSATSAGAVTLLQQTANTTTLGSAQWADNSLNVAAPVTMAPGSRYALGLLQVAGTPTSWWGQYTLAAGWEPVASRYIDGQSSIAASYTAGSLSLTDQIIFMMTS